MSILPSNYTFFGSKQAKSQICKSKCTTKGILDDAGLGIWTEDGKLRLLSLIEERKWLDSFFQPDFLNGDGCIESPVVSNHLRQKQLWQDRMKQNSPNRISKSCRHGREQVRYYSHYGAHIFVKSHLNSTDFTRFIKVFHSVNELD